MAGLRDWSCQSVSQYSAVILQTITSWFAFFRVLFQVCGVSALLNSSSFSSVTDMAGYVVHARSMTKEFTTLRAGTTVHTGCHFNCIVLSTKVTLLNYR